MQIEKKNITELKAAGYNPRKKLKPGDAEFEKLKKSIEEFGYVEPVIWNKQTGNIVGGHQRLSVLKHLGETEVDCVIIDLDKQKEKALNIALNKISGEWDIPLLGELLKDLDMSGFDVSLTGFEAEELDNFFKQALPQDIKEDDFDLSAAEEEISEPITKQGDIWLLGRHRLMCGDSTDETAVKKLMDGKTARFVFTDPPWNVDYGGSSHPSWKKRSIMNDNMSAEKFGSFLEKAFANMYLVCEKGAMVYVVMSAQEWGNIMNVMNGCGFHWSSTVIWVKDTLVLSRKDYHTQYEPLWYGWKDDARLYPLKDRKQSDVWNISRPKKSELHPTMKPIELISKAIINSSRVSDICIDFFGGSGSTIIAAEQTDRFCYALELDPKYCDIIKMRYQKAFPDEEIKLIRNGKEINVKTLEKQEKNPA